MWRCRDIRVMCGAECNTDHKLLRMKIAVGRKLFKHRCSCKRFDATKLCLNHKDNEGSEVSAREQFTVGICN